MDIFLFYACGLYYHHCLREGRSNNISSDTPVSKVGIVSRKDINYIDSIRPT